MSYERRSFEGAAVATTLNGSITNASTSIVITAATGWPDGSSGDFFVVIDRGNAAEEKVLIDTRSSTTLTVAASGRGADDTTAQSHSSGAAIELCFTARDADEANYVVAETVGKITTSQDLLVADGANSLTRLAVGSNGHLLQVSSGSLAYGALPDGAVTTAAKLADGIVTEAKLAANSVTVTKIADDSVTAAKILDGDITADHLATSVAGNGLTGGLGTPLAVVTDGATLGISADTLAVANLGIGTAQIAADAVTTAKIANAQVTNAKLASEVWTSYTATLGGTGWDIGDGTKPTRYVQMNRLVIYSVKIVFGSTSNFGSAALTITLPVTAGAKEQRGFCYLRDEGAGFDWMGGWEIAASGTVATFKAPTTGSTATVGRLEALDSDSPFTWASTDSIVATIVYEAAS